MSKEPEIASEWLREIVSDFERAESEMPEPEFLRGDYPEWVAKLAREIIGTLFPSAKLSPNKPWTPGEVGAMTGHRLAQLRGIEDAPELKLPKEWESIEVDGETERQFEKWCKGFVSAWIETEIVIGKALTLAAQQPHHEAKAFFKAFTKAYLKKPVDLQMTNFHRPTTHIYLLMFTYWRTVEQIPSVVELHRRLCRVLTPALVGDQKRIEKICQRLGLRLGPRGRPSKKRKTDIAA